MIAVINYGMGNICSLGNTLKRLGAEWQLTSEPDVIRKASHIILPGVGNAAKAMENLTRLRLTDEIRQTRRPVLGICVGMQVMCRHSEEGDAECMGIFDTRIQRFKDEEGLKIPHMGWSRIANMDSKLFKGINSGSYVYFVHSYHAPLCPDTIATARHGGMFSASLRYENFYGTQFHPEKSGAIGEAIIDNFLKI